CARTYYYGRAWFAYW
nr:immunoglobulin heavy chain junction region [Mus musculus]